MTYKRTKKKSPWGFTLVELIVYMVIFLVLMSTVLTVFSFVQRSYKKAVGSIDIEREAQTAYNWLKKDLSSTSLSSIRVYPNHNKSGDPRWVGVSMISAYSIPAGGSNEIPKFQMSQYGVPLWKKFVFYTIEENEECASPSYPRFLPKTGKLVRWEMKLPNGLTYPGPIPAEGAPISGVNYFPWDQPAGATSRRTIMQSVKLPGQPYIGKNSDLGVSQQIWMDNLRMRIANGSLNGSLWPAVGTPWDYGGFKVSFVTQRKNSNGNILNQYWEGETDINPSDTTSDKTATTDLVRVEIIALKMSAKAMQGTGQPSAYKFDFEVCPRN